MSQKTYCHLLPKTIQEAGINFHLLSVIRAEDTSQVSKVLIWEKYNINAKFNYFDCFIITRESQCLSADETEESIRQLYENTSNIKCEKELTPLHLAAQLKNTEIVNLLMNFGADATILDTENRTPIDYMKANNLDVSLLSIDHLEKLCQIDDYFC